LPRSGQYNYRILLFFFYFYYSMTTPAIDIATLLKRLEIYKNAIEIKDTEDIAYQTTKLKKLTENAAFIELGEDINEIITAIENKSYGIAMQLISGFLGRYQSLTKWTDPEIQGLQLEIHTLSIQISSLEDELTDLEKTIHEFEVKHTQELGLVILNILSLKRKLAAKQAQAKPNDTEAKKNYEEAQTEEEQYKGTYEETKKNTIPALNDEQEKELKTKFRKITKMTHPDLVDKSFEKEATELFMKAKHAKDNNDLKTINEILDYLETGKPFTLKHETITENEALKTETTRLRYTIEQLVQKISTIKNSETYQAIAAITDWDQYFAQTKNKLQTELEQLENLSNE